MSIFEVSTESLSTWFYQVPNKLYAGNRNWFPALGADLEQVFSEDKNSLFKSGDLKRWIALDKWNNISGRIAAFWTQHGEEKRGGFGFFETTEDPDVANGLLDTAFDWLKKNHCVILEGPMNFGEKDRFSGLLTAGFDCPAIYLENYNPPFYESFFREYSLVEKDTILTYKVQLDELPSGRLKLIADRLKSKYEIDMMPFSYERLDEFIHDIHLVYSSSFREESRLKLITEDDLHGLLKQARPVLGDGHIWLAYHNHDPIGFLAFMKDLNHLLRGGSKEVVLKGFGVAVVPGFRNIGVELGLSHAFIEFFKRMDVNCTLYFTGINSKTESMISFMKKLNASLARQHKTFQLSLKPAL